MKKVYLLKSYNGHNVGEIIEVTNNVAFGLIENGTARTCADRDFLVKPEFGKSKAVDTKKLFRSRYRKK